MFDHGRISLELLPKRSDVWVTGEVVSFAGDELVLKVTPNSLMRVGMKNETVRI